MPKCASLTIQQGRDGHEIPQRETERPRERETERIAVSASISELHAPKGMRPVRGRACNTQYAHSPLTSSTCLAFLSLASSEITAPDTQDSLPHSHTSFVGSTTAT